MIRIIIADDVALLRNGLRLILEQDKEIEVVALAENGLDAYEKYKELQPDLVLMDMQMPTYDGLYGIKKIKAEFDRAIILVLTTFDDDETVNSAIAEGADGYILKEMKDEEIIHSVKSAADGISVFGKNIFKKLNKKTAVPPLPNLTEREKDILRLVANGLDNKEIAAELFLAEGTVRNNVSSLLGKLSLKDRTQLAVFAVKNNLD